MSISYRHEHDMNEQSAFFFSFLFLWKGPLQYLSFVTTTSLDHKCTGIMKYLLRQLTFQT